MIKLIKRDEMSKKQFALMQLGAIGVALILAAVIMLLMGYNPITIYVNIIKGSLGSTYRLRATMNKAIPLVVLSLGIAVAFRMKFWNIGAEGQMCMGGFGAAFVALYFGDLPMGVLLPAMFFMGLLCGGLWAVIPALLKNKFGTSETLVTLMLNYIALKWITYLQYGPWKAPGGFPKIATFSENAILPSVFGVHIGWIIALVLCFAIHIMTTRSKLGYEIAVIGESQATARYVGIHVAKVTLIAVMLSGGLCGAAGMIQCSAVEKTLTEQFTNGLGFTAVITAWLARLSAPIILITSFLFGMLIQGGSSIETSLKIPAAMTEVLQGLIIFCILGSEFFVQYKVKFQKDEKGGAKA